MNSRTGGGCAVLHGCLVGLTVHSCSLSCGVVGLMLLLMRLVLCGKCAVHVQHRAYHLLLLCLHCSLAYSGISSHQVELACHI
jgi:hypothetical protein